MLNISESIESVVENEPNMEVDATMMVFAPQTIF